VSSGGGTGGPDRRGGNILTVSIIKKTWWVEYRKRALVRQFCDYYLGGGGLGGPPGHVGKLLGGILRKRVRIVKGEGGAGNHLRWERGEKNIRRKNRTWVLFVAQEKRYHSYKRGGVGGKRVGISTTTV